jgi:hypothetical protein
MKGANKVLNPMRFNQGWQMFPGFQNQRFPGFGNQMFPGFPR